MTPTPSSRLAGIEAHLSIFLKPDEWRRVQEILAIARTFEAEAKEQRERAERAEHQARLYYLADGTTFEDEPEEIIKRRKAAAKALANLKAERDAARASAEVWSTKATSAGVELHKARADATHWKQQEHIQKTARRYADQERDTAKRDLAALRVQLKDALDDQRIYRERWREADEDASDWSKAAEVAEDYIETLDAGAIANYRSYVEARAREASGGNYCTCQMGCWGIQNWNPHCPVHKSALSGAAEAAGDGKGVSTTEEQNTRGQVQRKDAPPETPTAVSPECRGLAIYELNEGAEELLPSDLPPFHCPGCPKGVR